MATAEKPPRRNIKPLNEKIHASEPGEPPGGSKITNVRRIPADTFQSKIFYWGVIADGDCFMRNAHVLISNNGNCYFYGETSTTDAGDVWRILSLDFHDANGISLWPMPEFDGPVMTQDNTDYIFSREDLAYPAVYFPFITGVRMRHSC